MIKMENLTTLSQGLQNSFCQFGSKAALEVDGQIIEYAHMADQAGRIAKSLIDTCNPSDRFVGVLAYRSQVAYTAVQAVLLSGKAYMPLHPSFPVNRTARMIQFSGCRTIIADHTSMPVLADVLESISVSLTIIFPTEVSGARELSAKFSHHQFLFSESISSCVPDRFPTPEPKDPAYLLFTSGSTGNPKGVAVTNENVCAYLHYTIERYGVTSEDRISQMFDLTFDLSVHDLFVSWLSGATLCVVPEKAVMAPAKFIRDQQLTIWFSVPSVAMFMTKMRMLKPGVFPSLRASLFCGEALPSATAEAWQDAASNSIVENLYGPTEATIAITNYRWDSGRSPIQSRNNLVPIGEAFTDQATCVVDESLRELPPEQIGELYLSGTQVTPGYLNDDDRTRQQFVQLPDSSKRWYRTGDLAVKDVSGCLYYIGRTDSQVQIMGHRVELAEIEGVLRDLTKSDLAVCVAWPIEQGRADGVYAFVVGPANEDKERKILEACKGRLPDYMVPRQLFHIETLPLNANGKIDRKNLESRISQSI